MVLGLMGILLSLLGCGGRGGASALEAEGSCGESMTWKYDKRTKTLTISGSGEMVTENRFMWSDYPIKRLDIAEGIVSIAPEAFYGNRLLQGELRLPSTLERIGEFAFYGCTGLTALTLGGNLRSVGASAFRGCGALRSAVFTGTQIPDYHGPDEESPSFPEGCRVETLPGAESLRLTWERESRAGPASPGKESGGAEKEMPYYWTSALEGRDYRGSGRDADILLRFEGGVLRLYINGRLCLETDYAADPNDNEDRTVRPGAALYCRDGWMASLRYSAGYGGDDRLTGEITLPDGTRRSFVFHTGSEEALYLDEEGRPIPAARERDGT